ncbi:antitoxin [Nitriliruptoraceae bacterium ZYF776]|nr:antitoxin [Profundirhabdus halotolerans]
MRTTVTLDPDVEAHLRRVMRERGIGFKQALNDAVRRGFAQAPSTVEIPTFSLGEATVPLDGALRLAADLEDEELVRRAARGS